jgi:hypothetical protein
VWEVVGDEEFALLPSPQFQTKFVRVLETSLDPLPFTLTGLPACPL